MTNLLEIINSAISGLEAKHKFNEDLYKIKGINECQEYKREVKIRLYNKSSGKYEHWPLEKLNLLEIQEDRK